MRGILLSLLASLWFVYIEAGAMGKYKPGDHVKIEVEDRNFGVDEWM